MVWYGMVWYGMVWYGMVWYGMVWYGMVWYGMVWYAMVWYGMVWYGMVWYGVIWYGMAQYREVDGPGGAGGGEGRGLHQVHHVGLGEDVAEEPRERVAFVSVWLLVVLFKAQLEWG